MDFRVHQKTSFTWAQVKQSTFSPALVSSAICLRVCHRLYSQGKTTGTPGPHRGEYMLVSLFVPADIYILTFFSNKCLFQHW
jgi:hypothetical protein